MSPRMREKSTSAVKKKLHTLTAFINSKKDLSWPFNEITHFSGWVNARMMCVCVCARTDFLFWNWIFRRFDSLRRERDEASGVHVALYSPCRSQTRQWALSTCRKRSTSSKKLCTERQKLLYLQMNLGSESETQRESSHLIRVSLMDIKPTLGSN